MTVPSCVGRASKTSSVDKIQAGVTDTFSIDHYLIGSTLDDRVNDFSAFALGSIKSSSCRAFLAYSVDEVVISDADTSSSVEVSTITARRSSRFALIDVHVEDITIFAGS